MANPPPLSPNLFVPTGGASAVFAGAKVDPGGDGSEACTTQSFALRLQGIPSPFWLGGVLVWKLIHAKWAMRKGERKKSGGGTFVYLVYLLAFSPFRAAGYRGTGLPNRSLKQRGMQ